MKRRVISINMEKQPKDAETESSDPKTFEVKTDVIRKALEGIGAKMFLGICIYMVLDTRRQVKIAEAEHHCQEHSSHNKGESHKGFLFARRNYKH